MKKLIVIGTLILLISNAYSLSSVPNNPARPVPPKKESPVKKEDPRKDNSKNEEPASDPIAGPITDPVPVPVPVPNPGPGKDPVKPDFYKRSCSATCALHKKGDQVNSPGLGISAPAGKLFSHHECRQIVADLETQYLIGLDDSSEAPGKYLLVCKGEFGKNEFKIAPKVVNFN